MAFRTRFDEDRSRPPVRSALRDLAVRAVLPGVVIWVAIVGFGALLGGPLKEFGHREESVNRSLASDRTPTWDGITMVWSHLGNTEYVIGVCLLVVALVWWRTRQWWYAVVPLVAISLQATIFVLATLVIGRDRPDVKHLDPAPPTSSYPSGHVGASTALYVCLALMATRIRHVVLRTVVVLVCLLVPLLVSFARLYRGMHHPTDVAVGLLNGLCCVVLAWLFLRREPAGSQRETRVPSGGRAQTLA